MEVTRHVEGKEMQAQVMQDVGKEMRTRMRGGTLTGVCRAR